MLAKNEKYDPLSMRRNTSLYYKPEKVKVLFIAEAPPCAEERYFYFGDVFEKDSLWVELTKALYRNEFGKTSTSAERKRKGSWLQRFCEDGYYLIDAVETPVQPGEGTRLIRDNMNRLTNVIKIINPNHIILIKATVYDILYNHLRRANLPVVNKRIPFPAAGRQGEFHEAMRRALDEIGMPPNAN